MTEIADIVADKIPWSRCRVDVDDCTTIGWRTSLMQMCSGSDLTMEASDEIQDFYEGGLDLKGKLTCGRIEVMQLRWIL